MLNLPISNFILYFKILFFVYLFIYFFFAEAPSWRKILLSLNTPSVSDSSILLSTGIVKNIFLLLFGCVLGGIGFDYLEP